ncbi:MAG: cold shock domain-containing protein [Bacteroidetes bacterium]|nr:MAG: cold shock domain-containing protein [Bacteroidota bacterium]
MHQGTVKFFNHDKGYGFITDAETQESIFVHINNASYPLEERDKVTFEVEMGPKGPSAVNVVLVEG